MQTAESYRFGPFVLDTARMALMQGDREIELRPKAFETLLMLLRHSGRVVSKDELVAAVWPDVIVNDDALAQCVRDVRKAIADAEHGYIRTLSRRGYMFVHPVVAGAPPSSIALRSVAVLPFEADGAASTHLANALTDGMSNGLAQLQGLRLAPRTSVFRYKGSAAKLQDIARELGVVTLVTATVSRREERLKVQLDLVDAVHDSQVWGAVYEGGVTELLHLQARILRDLSRALEVPHSERAAGQPAQPVSSNPDAYRAYLQGRHSWNQRSEEGLRQAIERFQLATQIDPRFAAAYSGLADCYVAMAKASYIAPSEAFPTAKWHATKALELDGSLCESYASLGFVKLYYEWDWAAAEAEFQRAIALDPNYAVSHEWYSVFLLTAGRQAEAAREIQLAHRLDPLSIPINCTVGFHHYYTAQYDEAVKQLKFVLEMSRDFPPAHLWLGRSYQELGRFEEAFEQFRWVGERAQQWPVLVAARGFLAGVAGRTSEARDSLAELQSLAGNRFVTAYSVALVHAGLGDDNSAFEWLNRAFDERSNWLIWLRLDPRWKSLRSDIRFVELVGRIRFPPGNRGASQKA